MEAVHDAPSPAERDLIGLDARTHGDLALADVRPVAAASPPPRSQQEVQLCSVATEVSDLEAPGEMPAPSGPVRILQKVAAEVAQSPLLTVKLRRRVLRLAGVRLGRHVDVKDRVRFVDRNTVIGDRSWIGRYCYFEDHVPVVIGARVWLAAHCKLQTATHEIGPPGERAGRRHSRPIVIEDGAWLGAGVIVLPGVTIGAGCVIAAGSVVTRSAKPNALYAGVPARWKRDLPTC